MQRGKTASSGAQRAAPRVEIAADVALICAPTAGVRLFARCPPVHTIILGACRLAFGGAVHTTTAIALPANAPHDVLALRSPHACVAYLDPRRFRFADVERLAASWRGFVPGRDDLSEAVGDALRQPQRRVDARLLRALELLDDAETGVRPAQMLPRDVQLSLGGRGAARASH